MNLVMIDMGHDGGWGIHKAGCRDIERDARVNQTRPEKLTATTVEEAYREIIDAEILGMGFTRDDVHIHPCCKK